MNQEDRRNLVQMSIKLKALQVPPAPQAAPADQEDPHAEAREQYNNAIMKVKFGEAIEGYEGLLLTNEKLVATLLEKYATDSVKTKGYQTLLKRLSDLLTSGMILIDGAPIIPPAVAPIEEENDPLYDGVA